MLNFIIMFYLFIRRTFFFADKKINIRLKCVAMPLETSIGSIKAKKTDHGFAPPMAGLGSHPIIKLNAVQRYET